MFGIGSTELLVILVVALIVLGPKSLASVTRSLGKAMGEFRRVSTDFQRTLNAEAAQEEEAERRQQVKDRAGKAAEAAEAARAARRERLDAAQAEAEAEAREDAAALAASRENKAVQPPEGSPLADALAKSRAEAEAVAASSPVTAKTVALQTAAASDTVDGEASKGQNA